MDAEPQLDSLDGWVAVKENVFGQPEAPHKLRFLVAWNAVESKFAVTCHNRTLQEQAGGKAGAEDGGGGLAGEQPSWAGLYSSQALHNIHRQLAALNERLESCFPALPAALTGQSGLWALLFPGCPVLAEAELEALCHRLERYLGWALELCGRKALLDTLFAHDQDEEDEYFENLQEFRRKALKGQLSDAKEALRRVLHQHKDASKLVALMDLYEEEDEAYWALVTVATQFYQYLLQPFRDMRELATLYRLEILKALRADRLGPKRIEALQKEAEEWAKQAEEAVCSIQDITVGYFRETVTALAAMQKQMEQDRKRFGQAAWAAASPRLENLKYLLAKETLQHMRAKELCLNHKRADIRKKMQSLGEQENDMACVEELEIEYYETQLELYEVQFEILKNEEMLLVTQLETLRRQMKEIQDEVVYYDTCENPDELEAADQGLELTHAPSSEMVQLRQRTQQLETKRGIICSRRAYLRNKKDQCEESRRLRLQEARESTRHFLQHHSIQMKRDKKKEEEKTKKAWIKQEREKTLERLKTFKEKCPAQFVLKTSRSQPLNSKQPLGASRRTPSAKSTQPLSISGKLPPKHSRTSRPIQAKGPKALRPKPSADIPIHIFAPPADPKHCKQTEEVPPLPPLPPPPPAPPLPDAHLGGLKRTTQASDQPLPLVSEEPPRRSPGAERAAKTAAHTANTCTGTMDEVLASLRRGEILLRKVEPPRPPPSSGSSLNDGILAAIRQGVKLRKVSPEPKTDLQKASNNELERSIKAAMLRIKKVSADSEEDENNDQNSGEWNS
ncbi:WASP homolog-associated protein with actin, membranes and microtubules [Hemicordylus capensis]|uniref:WASP homolog-associated protein with actin, membranes and microtubules n=1 Tax=Hemicordylus capensis TaxID=884348 RepID=UPI0023028281|nr:WASP homolog-associated protein with actin, membranes and microtubules [Hemicordylus capensis]